MIGILKSLIKYYNINGYNENEYNNNGYNNDEYNNNGYNCNGYDNDYHCYQCDMVLNND